MIVQKILRKSNFILAIVSLLILGLQSLDAQEYDPFGEYGVKSNTNSTVNMHLLPEGEFEVGRDQWGDIVRVNMLKIKDMPNVPGVKKAWIMKGFEGEEGMAWHPIISEVKDVDGDGILDVFRCRSEHEGARIERLNYDDGSVVWESEPMAALHGDESRLPVFDLDGDGVYSVLHATKGGTWCINAQTGKTEWSVKEARGDIIVGHFLDKKKQAVLVRSEGTLRCYNEKGKLEWRHETGLKGDDAYSHEAYRYDADGDGLDEIFANWQKLTMALKGDGTVLWEDQTQAHHSDYLVCADVDADGKVELIYDHEGCAAEKGPVYIVDPMTGTIENKIDYRGDGLSHAQNLAVGDFDPERPGLEIALCGKMGNLFVWGGDGELLWNRNVPSSLLSKGDWDGDGVEDIACFALGANVDGMFSVWNGRGERLYAISFLPGPSNRTWREGYGGSWSHAMPGGHEGVRRQVDLDGNGYADYIMPFGAWHWGSDAILFLMEGSKAKSIAKKYSTELDLASVKKVVNDAAEWQATHMPDRGRNPAYNPKYTGWADGVFLSALADWAEYDNSRMLVEWYEKIAEEQQWEVGHRSLNPANDISVAVMYAKIWQKEEQPRYTISEIEQWDGETISALAGGWKELIPTIERLDYQMKYYPKTDNIKFEIAQNQERWCWCDALYMAAPTYALFANITGNDAYREFMNREFWFTMETLYDKEERLVFRDTRFITEREANGEKVFWGRGNGWVVGAFARVMDFLPADYHSREKYEQYFVQIISRIVELQGADGYWRSSLLDPESYPSVETSATGFYTYALWWGINKGLLDKESYLEPASRAWEAMVKAVQRSGKLGYVQAIGDTPQNVSADSNDVYGTAAFMLAGLEVSKYLLEK